MESEIIWITPLLMLPGVATLIISTASRYSEIHEEIHQWMSGEHDFAFIQRAQLLIRARHFRNALVFLYLCVFILVFASLLGSILDFVNVAGDAVVFGILILGVVLMGAAATELIRESRLSFRIIETHLEQVMRERGTSEALPEQR